MKTDGTPLHGSYFDQAAAKHPDLKGPAGKRRNQPKKRRGARFGILPVVLSGTLAGVAWLALALKPSENLPHLPLSGETHLASQRRDRPDRLAARASESAWKENSGQEKSGQEYSSRDTSATLLPATSETPRERPEPLLPAPAVVPKTEAVKRETQSQEIPEPSKPRARERTDDATLASREPDTESASSSPPAADSMEPDPVEPDPVEPAAIVPARRIFGPSPEYPTGARQAGEQGTVVVRADIDATGAVTGTTIVRGHSPSLDAAAAAALETWRFEPARRGDVAIPSTYQIGIKFALRETSETPANDTPRLRASGATTRSGPLEVGGDVEPPRRLSAPLPTYPDAAWAQGITGDVLVRAVIDANGTVTDVEVVKGLPYGMTEAAVEAIRRWTFAPATRHGQPVAVYRNLSVRFEG